MQRPALVWILLVAAISLPGLAPADMRGELRDSTPEQRAKAWTLAMQEKLDLTEAQLPKVEAIHLEAAQKMEPIRKGSQRKLAKLRAAREIEADRDTALKGVLSAPQYERYQAAREELRKKVEQRIAERRG